MRHLRGRVALTRCRTLRHGLLDRGEIVRVQPASRVTAQWEFEREGKVFRLAVSGPLVATTPELEAHAALVGSASSAPSRSI